LLAILWKNDNPVRVTVGTLMEHRWQGKPQPLRNHVAANRAARAAAASISAQSVGLESKKTSGRGGVFFLGKTSSSLPVRTASNETKTHLPEDRLWPGEKEANLKSKKQHNLLNQQSFYLNSIAPLLIRPWWPE
jgi:hypothetical protein